MAEKEAKVGTRAKAKERAAKAYMAWTSWGTIHGEAMNMIIPHLITPLGPSTRHGRTRAAFGPTPIAISDRFRPIAEEPETTAIAVPIADLIVQRPRKLKIKGRNTLKSKFARPSVCECCPKPIDKPTDIEEPEIITFYHHDELAMENAAVNEDVYPPGAPFMDDWDS